MIDEIRVTKSNLTYEVFVRTHVKLPEEKQIRFDSKNAKYELTKKFPELNLEEYQFSESSLVTNDSGPYQGLWVLEKKSCSEQFSISSGASEGSDSENTTVSKLNKKRKT